MNEKTILRKAHNRINPYVMISRSMLHDIGMSWKAKGLLAYLLSLPDDWEIHVSELPKHAKDGIWATRKALDELKQSRHIVGRRIRTPDGKRLAGMEYLVYECPLPKHLTGREMTDSELTEYWQIKEEREINFWADTEDAVRKRMVRKETN
jgi:hypothetical protein